MRKKIFSRAVLVMVLAVSAVGLNASPATSTEDPKEVFPAAGCDISDEIRSQGTTTRTGKTVEGWACGYGVGEDGKPYDLGVSPDGDLGVFHKEAFESEELKETLGEGTGDITDAGPNVLQESRVPWSTESKGPGFSIDSVIGYDDRTQVTATAFAPSSRIVHFNGCTGYLYAPNMVATAGHCLYKDGAWKTPGLVTPGKNGSGAPYGSCTVAARYVSSGWINNNDLTQDYGKLKLNCNIGNTVGVFTLAVTQSLENATVRGYPAEKPFATMWTHTGPLYELGVKQVFYRMDTTAGQSGSPVYRTCASGVGICAIAIHTYGIIYGGIGSETSANHGIRLIDSVRSYLNTY
ncbi:trypsin-like serine peptidase [Arthrobacter sp. CAN_A1]|uniref:trypsin-like serine peptidase n=1 Tax=Arthrobacter sp. CAN_A1 TaxID=2787717 RepID=UPI0018C97947